MTKQPEFSFVVHPSVLSSQYNLEEWNIPAADRKGHSAKLSVRWPPVISRCLEIILASRNFPYQTVDDIVRHAVVRHVYALVSRLENDGHPVDKDPLWVADAIIRTVSDSASRDAIRDSVSVARHRLDQLASEGDWAELLRLCAYIDQAIQQIPESSPWRQRFSAEWKTAAKRYREAAKRHKK